MALTTHAVTVANTATRLDKVSDLYESESIAVYNNDATATLDGLDGPVRCWFHRLPYRHDQRRPPRSVRVGRVEPFHREHPHDVEGGMTMRIDELYNLGGFDPKHPSGNVLDAFEHHDDAILVKHYDIDGSVLVDRPLTADEAAFFFPPPGEGPPIDLLRTVQVLGDAFVMERIEATK